MRVQESAIICEGIFMNKKRIVIFQTVISLFLAVMVFFMTFINTSEFCKDYEESTAENNYIVLNSIVDHIEYGIKYGKRLDNYYDIDQIFENLEKYCKTDQYFIADQKGDYLYGKDIPEWFQSEFIRLESSSDDYIILTHGETKGILTKIQDGENTLGFAGIFYYSDRTDEVIGEYVHWMYLFAGGVSVVGILIFLLLFRIVKHGFDAGKLTKMILPIVIGLNLLALGNSYLVFRDGYTAIADEMAQQIISKNADEMERLIESGVNYSDILNPESYFSVITKQVIQLSDMRLSNEAVEGYINRELLTDDLGEKSYLSVKVSEEYIGKKVSSAVMNVIVSAVTEVMIASELLMFLIGLLVKTHESRRKTKKADGIHSYECVEVVKGISFFFASFRYMSIAFMTIVLAQIYQPIVVFGYEIPYEIVMGIPLSAQVFLSTITSYISGTVIDKKGWKKASLFGVTIMCMGTLASAFAKEPISFIFAQMLVGMGLGFAKMGIDIYAVAVASEEDMSAYTSGANASIIVGLSCSALVGALFADTFGYSGAYIAMTIVGVMVFVLICLFGQDAIPHKEKEEVSQMGIVSEKWDFRFGGYILFIIIPYFFIMMFVDYFFPVYAVENGMTVDNIGYVMLFYGMATAYIGARFCDRLMKKFSPAVLMSVTMLLLSGAIFLFAIKNHVMFTVVIVLLIGVVDGVMPSAQFEYVYHLPISKKLGFSKTLGIEGFFSSLIGAVAPVIFSVLMMYGNGGLVVVAAMVCVSAVLFLMLNGKKKKMIKTTGLILVCSMLVSQLFNLEVCAKNDKLVIGYCQAESYYEFDYQLYDIMMGMQERGDITVNADGLSEESKAHQIWEVLTKAKSELYVFSADSYIDFSGEDYAGLSEEEIAVKIQKIIETQGIDLMLTMGTSAGTMVKDCSNVDYMNFLASDPVGSEIVSGDMYSGIGRGWAHVNSGVDERALAVMDDLFSPRKVGIVYNFDDPEAYIYSSAQSVDKYCQAEQITVEKRSVSDSIEDTGEAYEQYVDEMKSAHEALAKEEPDVYILTTSLLEPEDFKEVLEPLVKQGIPVFSINSTEDVRYGATAAIEMLDYRNIGRFAAETIYQYQQGSSLDELTQKYDTAPFLVLNIDTLHDAGMKLPLDVLLSASSIYREYVEGTL